MINTSKMKVYVFILGLMLAVGQGFAMDPWTDHKSSTAPQKVNDCYQIYTPAELAWFAHKVNANQTPYCAEVRADLNMDGYFWIPISSKGTKRAVNFNGNGFIIKNLYISAEEILNKYPKDTELAQNLGLIGAFIGHVQNVILENVEVYAYGKNYKTTGANPVEKPLSIGTVVGWQSNPESIVENCYVTGKMVTSGDGQSVGGIVGNNGGGTITNCYSAVDIDANGTAYVGGIVGYTKEFDKGAVASISSCVYAGNTLSSTGSGKAGAIVGNHYNGKTEFENVYYDSEKFDDAIGRTMGGSTTGSPTGTTELNSELIACTLNGGEIVDGACTEDSPWSAGATSICLDGYGADGYKITFNANGGSFAGGTTFVKYVKAGNTINNDGVADPTWANDDYVFAGWSGDAYNNAATKATTITATWNPMHTIKFSPVNGKLQGTFPNGSSDPISIKIEDGKRIVVQGFARPTSFIDAQNVKYNFMGWADGNDPTVLYVDENGLDNLPVATENMTLVAAWTTAPVYTVRFYENESSTASYVSSVYENEKANELTIDKMDPHPGYTFEGWFERGASTSFNFNQTITKDVNLYAKWVKNSYTVNYVLNCSDECSNSNAGEFTVDGMTLSDPVWDEKHSFLGWYTDPEFKDKKTSIPAGLTENITLYAEWKLITYEITYRAGTYGIGLVPSEKKIHNEEYTLRGASYTRTGYIQGGWSTKDDGSDFLAFNSKYVENADLILYPYWTLQTFTVTYDRGDYGVGDIAPATRAYGANLLLSTEVFTRDGYVQNGWIYTTNDETIEYDLGAAFDVNADVTLIPRWVPAYTVTYNAGGFGEGTVAAGIKTHDVDLELSSETFARANYTQDGWMITENGDAVDYALGAAYAENADITLYPHWVIKTYTAEYDLNGGSMDGNASFTFTIESDELPLATPNERQGFSFAGWRDSKTGEVLTDAFPANSSGDRTLTAQWSLLPITVTAGSGTFEYDGKIHNAECSYEGTLPIGFSIEMDPSGSVHKVADGDVTTTCAVAIKDEFNNDVTNQFTELTIVDGSISVVAKAVPYGAVTIYTDETGNSAVINGEYTGEDEYSLDEEISVNSVVLNRTFTAYVPVTLTLPFDIDVDNVENARFYVFGGVSVDENGKKAVEANRVTEGTLAANTPYMVVPTGASILFKGSVTFRETVDPITTVGAWQFCGTYSYKTVAAENVNSIYGIKGSADGEIPQGSFVKFMEGSWFVPMRAYLLNTEVSDRRLARAYSAAKVNNSRFEIIWNEGDEETVEEQTTSVRKPVVSSKVVNMRRAYDLKGRQVNGETKVKGAYYNKKVVK